MLTAKKYLEDNGYKDGMIWTLDNVERVCEQYHNKANRLEKLVLPKIADLQKQNSKLIALLQMRDGGDHDNDCKANYGRQCNCGHDAVKLYLDSNFSV